MSIVDDYNVRLTITAPTSSPTFYNLPSIFTPIDGSYETQLIVVQHFTLITDCNSDNLSTRQCQLLCRREFIRKKCQHCRPVSMDMRLVGKIVADNSLPTCTINDYKKLVFRQSWQIYYNVNRCYNDSFNDEKDVGMNECLSKCVSPCDYWKYELSTERTNGTQSRNTLIAPLNDYVEFIQKSAYTWYKVVADFGGLLYVYMNSFNKYHISIQRILARRWFRQFSAHGTAYWRKSEVFCCDFC